MKSSIVIPTSQAGSSLLEVLIAILLLSFGMLSLGAMLSFSVQMPKLSGYRATAVNLASGYIERMRANPDGFGNGGYDKPSSYDSSHTSLTIEESDICAYPTCDAASLAGMDFAEAKVAVRTQLPAGGMLMLRESSGGISNATNGNFWIVWQEPDSLTALDPSSSDNCPAAVTTTYADAKPHCLYVRFKI